MLSFIFKISRFRFWIYTGGTFVVGYALAANALGDFFKFDYYIYLIYFFFFANVFIYGVNDYWDEETDKNNPKKDEKEHRIVVNEKEKLIKVICLVTGLSLVLMVFQTNLERVLFSVFLILSYFYSSPPFRFKERPFLDFSSNYLYIMPGIFAYSMIANSLPSLIIMLGAYFHISAMHIFSAIPDIKYDREAGINTTPVYMGKKPALILTLIFWLILSVIVIILADFRLLSLLVLIYPLFPLLILFKDDLQIDKLYWYLPYVNTSLGGLLFVALVLYNILGISF
jgi:4-hydroxybenzoate polyprenyltransferase